MIVLGVGNILLSDEGIGVHVVNALKERGSFPGIELVDGGVAGFSLINIIEDHERVFLIDCISAPFDPGSILILSPDEIAHKERDRYSLHDFNVRDTIDLMMIRGTLPDMTILGIIPYDTSSYNIGLSNILEDKFEAIIGKVTEEIKSYFSIK